MLFARIGLGGERESISAPVVFAGHGVTALEVGCDDPAQVDARGKGVAVLLDVPKALPGRGRADATDYTDLAVLLDERARAASERGLWQRCYTGGSRSLRTMISPTSA